MQIILCQYRNISTSTNILRSCNQEDFISVVYNTSVQLGIFATFEFLSTTHERKVPYGEILEFLLLDALKTLF